MSSQHKRSSILKKRPSVGPASLEASPTETTTTTKATKRIGFKPKKSVKEFFASEETATIWCNSYELSADGTPPCLVVNDNTTLKNVSDMDLSLPPPKSSTEQGHENKENAVVSTVEDRRTSYGETSSWDLSISAYEDEKRRVKSENSINSSVLNMTERLMQEPISQARPILCQKQDLGVCSGSSAMDISPAKVDGRQSSPKKLLYHHPKQNMFVSIDMASEKEPAPQNSDDLDLNFFGPQTTLRQTVSENTSSRIVFQTSNNTPNQQHWRNKSIQTDPRPSSVAVGFRSIAVNADLSSSVGWSSHAVASESFFGGPQQHLTSFGGNSQFEISEAWNSHPAAALKLKMLQQGLIKPAEFDPRLSDGGGGGGGGENIGDDTITITQTVDRMLESTGSRPVSLDNTVQPEPMDVTNRRESYGGKAGMETCVQMDVTGDTTVTDVLLPANGLSKARPSFIPRATPMDHSESACSSPEIVESVSCCRQKNQRATILKPVPISTLDPGMVHENSPTVLPMRRETILQEDEIVEDDRFLTVPQVEVKTPPRSAMSQTVYEAGMEQSPPERGSREGVTTPIVVMAPVRISFSELIFGENSLGLEMTKSCDTQQHQEPNRPKIHRIPSKKFMLGFKTIGTNKAETEQISNAVDIAVDSPEPEPTVEPSRKTVIAAADISLEVNMLNDSNKLAKDSRKTEAVSQDVSMESPVSEKPSSKRSTVFMNDNLNESRSPLGEAPQHPPRATMLFDERLNQTRLEPRSGSLEDLRSYGQSRRTIQRIEAMECISSDSPKVKPSNSARRTELLVGNMDQSTILAVNNDASTSPRLVTDAIENMDVTASRSPFAADALLEGKHQRATIIFNTDMDQSNCTRKSSSLGPFSRPPSDRQKSRQTIIGRESMEQTLIDGRSVMVQESTQTSQRASVFSEASMDETGVPSEDVRIVSSEVYKSRLTSHREASMDETCKSPATSVPEPETGQRTLRLSSLVPENINQDPCTRVQSSQSIYKEVDMEETATDRCDDIIEPTIRQSPTLSKMDHSKVAESFQKSRHTSYAEVNIDETLSPARKLEATLLERSKVSEQLTMQKSRNTVYQEALMDDTRTEPLLEPKPEIVEAKAAPALRTIDLTTPPDRSLLNKTSLPVPADPVMDQTIPSEAPTQPISISAPVRYTTYKQDSMEETTVDAISVPANDIPKSFQAENDFKLRRTVSCEQDMDQTVGAVRRVSTVEMDDSGRDAECGNVDELTTPSRQSEIDIRSKHGTSMPDRVSSISMDVSVIKFTSAPPENSHTSRRTIIQPINIAEDEVNRELKIEKSQTILIEESPTSHSIKQEQPDKSDFSFVIPQLPDDCVLRSTQQIPFPRSNQTLKTAPSLSQQECVNDSITEPSFSGRKISPMVDLSEITEKVEVSFGSERRPAVPSGNVSVVLSEVTEPPIVQPSVPVSVIQETPKKGTSMIPVRKSRGSIFDRISMDLDESGIMPIVTQEQEPDCESDEACGREMVDIVKKEPEPQEPVATQTLANERVESSDDEFFDAVPGSASIEESVEEIVAVTREAAMNRTGALGRGDLKFIHVNDAEKSPKLQNQTILECKTLKFIDINDLEQTALSTQKRQLSQISKSVLLEHDPLNASLTDDYPMKKRKTKIPTPVSQTKIQQAKRKTQRVTFHQDVMDSEGEEVDKCPEVETFVIKDEPLSIVDVVETDECSIVGQTLTDDHPMKERRSKIPTPVSHTKTQNKERTPRRHTLQQDVTNSEGDEIDRCPEVEAVIIKDELASVIDDETDERSKIGQTLLTDPSVFIIEESDMLANESISFVKSPASEKINRGSTLKLDQSYYNNYVNLTLHVEQTENASYIVISDDSVTVPSTSKTQDSKSQPSEKRLTLEDLPARISKARESLVLNSTVASEVMYELKQQVSEAGKGGGCCSFEGNCNCRNRRTMAAVKRENVETVREMWDQNFGRILESVSDIPKYDVPLDTRICEILSRPMKPLPLPCMEVRKPYLPETPSIWFLCENYMRSLQISETPTEVYNLCDLPATPDVAALISNKLETEGYRWFLDASEDSNMRLYLRHRLLRSVRFRLQLQRTERWYSKQEDIRIVGIEFVPSRKDLVCSPRYLLAHLEFVRAMDKITTEHLCSRYPTTASIMRLIEQLDSVVEPIFGKVDQLYRIVRNNGAILEQVGSDDQLVIIKFYEYQLNGTIQWNRIYVQFDAIDRIDSNRVAFHRKMINAECLLPTEHQCGRVDIQGLMFLECLLWNIEKVSIS